MTCFDASAFKTLTNFSNSSLLGMTCAPHSIWATKIWGRCCKEPFPWPVEVDVDAPLCKKQWKETKGHTTLGSCRLSTAFFAWLASMSDPIMWLIYGLASETGLPCSATKPRAAILPCSKAILSSSWGQEQMTETATETATKWQRQRLNHQIRFLHESPKVILKPPHLRWNLENCTGTNIVGSSGQQHSWTSANHLQLRFFHVRCIQLFAKPLPASAALQIHCPACPSQSPVPDIFSHDPTHDFYTPSNCKWMHLPVKHLILDHSGHTIHSLAAKVNEMVVKRLNIKRATQEK